MIPNPHINPQFYENIPSKRVLAWLVDGAISLFLTVIIAVLSFGIGFWFLFFIWFWVDLTTRILALATTGRTAGMAFVGLKLVMREGRQPSFVIAALHVIGTTFMLPTLLWLISLLLILRSDYRQSLVDMVLGTVMLPNQARH